MNQKIESKLVDLFMIDPCGELLKRQEMNADFVKGVKKKFGKFVKEVGAKMMKHPLRKFELNEKFESS